MKSKQIIEQLVVEGLDLRDEAEGARVSAAYKRPADNRKFLQRRDNPGIGNDGFSWDELPVGYAVVVPNPIKVLASEWNGGYSRHNRESYVDLPEQTVFFTLPGGLFAVDLDGKHYSVRRGSDDKILQNSIIMRRMRG